MKSHVLFVERLVKLLDTKFSVFGIRFGIDPLLDIWPGFGSLIGAGLSCYIFWIAHELKVPSVIYRRMAWHIAVDFVLGAIPFVGFAFDLFYRANAKNLALLTPYLHPDELEGVVIDG